MIATVCENCGAPVLIRKEGARHFCQRQECRKLYRRILTAGETGYQIEYNRTWSLPNPKGDDVRAAEKRGRMMRSKLYRQWDAEAREIGKNISEFLGEWLAEREMK